MSPTASDFSPIRRRLLLAAALAGLPALGRAGEPARRQTVTVVTSYPDEFVSRLEAGFEAVHPQYRLQVIWRNARDAAPFLEQPGHGGADVYWSPSPRNFARLAAAGIWRPLPVDRKPLPARIGNTRLGDAEGFYTASEIAGFGFAYDPAWFAARQMRPPTDWDQLTDPRLAGLIALPVPQQVGFAPPMVEIVLQAWGWDKGWALWSEIAGNALLVDRGATFVTDHIADGRCCLGLSIDFFVNSAIANGARIGFAYPRHTGLNPAHIAATRDSANPDGGKAFIDFVLSPAGQRLLLHPDIRRLPVRPDVYADLPETQYNPFQAADRGGLQFDGNRARDRLAISSAIFQHMLAEVHDELRPLWQRVHRLEASGRDLSAVRRALSRPPIDEAGADAPELRKIFADNEKGERGLIAGWRLSCATQRQEARRLLAEIEA